MRRSAVSRVVAGLCIIAAGIIVLGQVVGFWYLGNLYKSWWTLFLIIPGIAGIASSGFRFWNVFLVFIGTWLLAEDQNWLGKNTWPYFLGAFLVIFGIYVMAGGGRWHHGCDHSHEHDRHHHDGGPFSDDSSDFADYVSVFSSQSYRNRSQNFRGGKASSIFGGMTIDLREVKIGSTAFFEVNSVFGGLEVLVPKDVPLRVNVAPVFGTFYNDAEYVSPAAGQPCIEIKGASVFGSIRIV